MRPALPLLLAASLSLSGCHVVDRVRQCQALSKVLDAAGKELGADVIGDDPSAPTLRKKAQLYGRLAAQVKGVPLKNEGLRTEALAFTQHLLALEEQLNEAALAVDDRHKFEKSQGSPVRLSGPDGPPASQPVSAPTLPPKVATPGGGPSTPSATAPSQPMAKTLIPPPRSRALPPRLGMMDFTRRYLRVKRSAENTSRAILASAQNMERECR